MLPSCCTPIVLPSHVTLPFKTYVQGWPEPYIYTVYDRIFWELPANNNVFTPYIYGSGQPYLFVLQA